MKLSDSALSSLSSSLLSVECRVRLLSFELTSLTMVSPSALLRFLSEVSPSDVVFRMIRGCTPEHFGPQMCRFLSSRRYFSVSELVDDHAKDVPLSMDDAILGQLTSSVFHIGTPNYITSDGLRSFIKSISSGNLDVVAGRIHTSFAVDEDTLREAAGDVRLIEDQRIIDISTDSRKMLPPVATTA
ncbi:unnamed protein product [Heligmosomoides polygyrus]|uniref:NAD_binding_4 domain-containing protein n=1 Tax=Heligmosomoides polygyrus TaxID=6339 RepID=A0A183F809_HELPZ|nr:unnamed protein product [Heligmosomoides polygyrus]